MNVPPELVSGSLVLNQLLFQLIFQRGTETSSALGGEYRSRTDDLYGASVAL